ncbi:ABC transporter permease [Gordonia insulae]|uniref:Doxorubicin resistance ABC transporter permease protein DrrB n=1 Tax=Gordonia insulae TaxID=2420509 RepID=A0A3G8JT68_9ACTN|nr:ABC transporter permease [Gordonia insulae]AZG48354.1 Doxorubicin resistance ABC transporter permease protein DrrB [Gordonia insulae]
MISDAAVTGRPPTHAATQWWTLTGRGLAAMIRNGEIVFAFVAPVLLAICFYLPLRTIMDANPSMDYAAFLMPIIALQSVSFVASSAAMRASLDTTKGINTRFRTMPMPVAIPTLARLGTNTVLLVISVICAAATSLVMGWRPLGSWLDTVGLFAVVLAVGILIAVLADAIGLLSNSPEATSQALSLPILVLGMLSTGFVPEDQFPEWIQPFVRNQPISQFATSMRALSDGTATLDVLTPTIWWCAGLAIGGIVLTLIGVRRSVR